MTPDETDRQRWNGVYCVGDIANVAILTGGSIDGEIMVNDDLLILGEVTVNLEHFDAISQSPTRFAMT